MATGTIFDLLGSEKSVAPSQEPSSMLMQKEEPSQFSGKAGLFELAESLEPPPEKGYLDDAVNFGKNLLKAGVRGVHKFGRMMGPLPVPGKTEQEVQEEFTEQLDDLLPTEEGGYVSRSLERGLSEAPTMLTFPGGGTAQTAIRTGAAGFLGEGVKELGGGEIPQAIAELSAFIGPDLAKKLLASGSNKEIIEAARNLGLKDAEIAPLLQSEFKQKWLGKLASGRGKVQDTLKRTKEALGQVYNNLRAIPAAKTALPQQQATELINLIQDKLFEMPSIVREKIAADFKDLVSKPITGDSLINFWQDINATMKAAKNDLGDAAKYLSNLKDPLKGGLAKLSPQLANDFEWTNKLATRFYDISSRLKPNLYTDIMQASQAIKLLGGVTFGYYPVLVEFAGEAAARKLAREMLLNPRFQNLSNKMVSAINQNKWRGAEKILDSMIKEVKDISPEIAAQLQAVDFKELEVQE